MNRSAREQCQPHFTRGLPLPIADLSESNRELLKSLALPDQRSSTDFKPSNSPRRLPEGAGGSLLLSRRSWMQPCEHLAWCWGCDPSAGGCPLPAMDCQMHAAEILENSGEIFVDGAKRSVSYPSSGYGWKRSAVRTQRRYPCGGPRCWEAPEHPPLASLLMGLFLMEGEEKVIFPHVVAVRGRRKLSWGGRVSEVGLCQTFSRFARAPVVVLTLLHCAVASTL